MSETFTFDRSTEPASMSLTVTSWYRGPPASRQRRLIKSNGDRHYADIYKQYYENLYGQVDDGSSFSVDDDIEKNRIKTLEKYTISSPEESILKEFPIIGDLVRSVLKEPRVEARKAPFALPFPFSREHRVSINNLPTRYRTIEPVEIETRYLEFSARSYAEGTRKSFTWKLKTKDDNVRPEEHAEYREIYDTIQAQTSWTYNFSDSVVEEEIVATESTDAERGMWDRWGPLAVVGLALSGLLAALWFAVRWDREYAADALFYPVTPLKVALLLLGTFGLYAMFWFYKYWRWAARHDGLRVWAWARALFFVFYAHTAFSDANRRLPETNRLAEGWAWLVLLGGIAVFALNIAAGRIDEGSTAFSVVNLILLPLYLLVTLPPAMAVARLNRESEAGRKAMARNSQVSFLNLIAVLVGAWLYYAVFFLI